MTKVYKVLYGSSGPRSLADRMNDAAIEGFEFLSLAVGPDSDGVITEIVIMAMESNV